MHISIDTTEPISDLDRSILSLLVGGELIIPEVAEAPKPKAATKSRKKAKPEPEPEPEPIAEEPLEEEEEEEEVEEDFDEESDEDLLKLATKKASELVSSGDAAKVREALDAAGANRVRELNSDNVREFFKALS